jgi:uncharacterized OB-fold protein
MSPDIDYPRPVEDDDNRQFLKGWKDGKLFLQRSRQGGPPFFYPRPICPFTGSRDLVWEEASGNGRIVSFSIVMRPNHPAFQDDVPIILAEIMLDEGASLLARVVAIDIQRVQSGQRVVLVRDTSPARHPLPVFQPD